MDFYKKINIDHFKPKFPEIKIPTFKSRKIFKASKEELSKKNNSYTVSSAEQQDLPRYPPATFIERTPRRISTVSSLQTQEHVDDILVDSRVNGSYTNYEHRDFDEKKSRPVDEGLHQRFTRHYREFQEFKFKNIFGKRTVVRKTEISMDMYADRYKEDLKVERQRRPQGRQDSIEYNSHFQNNNQYSNEMFSSPTVSIKSNISTPIRNQIKEEFQKPIRVQMKECKFQSEPIESEEEKKPKVEYSQSWRFGTLRGRSLNRKGSLKKNKQSIRQKSIKKQNIVKKTNEKFRWTLKSNNKSKAEPSEVTVEAGIKKKWTFKKPKEEVENNQEDLSKLDEHRKNRWTLRKPKPVTSNDDEASNPPPPKKKWTLRSNTSIDDEPENRQTDSSKPLKKIKKKHKTRPKEFEIEDVPPSKEVRDATTKRRSWSVKKHFSSSIESYSSAKDDIRNSSWNFKKIKGSEVLSRWKTRTMQVLSQPNLSTVGLEGSSPEKKQKITLRIWKRNKHIKKSSSSEDVQHPKADSKSFFNIKYFNKKDHEEPVSVEEVIIDNKKLTHKERYENAKDRAKQVVNDQIQRLHLFRGQQASTNSEDSAKAQKRKTGFDEDLDDVVAAANIEEIQNSPAAIWASEQEFSQTINSLETNDFNMNKPKVLIRQQSYENREPTLVITMTTSRLHPHISPLFRGRKLNSLDSNDSDSWITNTYNSSIAEKELVENSAHFVTKDQTVNKEEIKKRSFKKEEVRKTSVDVFENKEPFENFENELQDTPVINIDSEIPPPPPSTSPPREESPEKEVFETIDIRSNLKVIKKNEKPLKKISKDSIVARSRSSFRRPAAQPPSIPERTASMVNLTRPIIKQGSLRRKLSADLESKNMGIGKVNSLINKFENSYEDLTDSTNGLIFSTLGQTININENNIHKSDDSIKMNEQTNEDPIVKLKNIDVRRKTGVSAVPIPSPRLTLEELPSPLNTDTVVDIPVILPVGNTATTTNEDNIDNNTKKNNNINNNNSKCCTLEEITEANNNLKQATQSSMIHSKEDENYFSLSDEGEFEISF